MACRQQDFPSVAMPGSCAAPVLQRRSERWMSYVLSALLVPVVVILLAIGMYAVYARLGLNDLWGLAAGHAVLGAPFVVITTMSAARQINPVLLLAARSLGARPISVFINITLPMIEVGVLSGAVFAF